MPTDYGQKVQGTGITRYERVEKASGGDGKWHYIDWQNLGQSCGPACARMIGLMVTSKRMGESYFAGLVSASEQGQSASLNPLSDGAQLGHDFTAGGTLSDHLVTALQQSKVKASKASAATTDWAATWQATSEKKPAIISVLWSGGGGSAHFIVIAGPMAGYSDRYLVLDPWYGVQQISKATPTTYSPRQGGGNAGLALGTGEMQISAGHWVECVLTDGQT